MHPLSPFQAFLLSRIEAGESPFTGGAHRDQDETKAALRVLESLGLWSWEDPEFQVLRQLTPLGVDTLREYRNR